MAVLAFQGDARNVGLIDSDKFRLGRMNADQGLFFTLNVKN